MTMQSQKTIFLGALLLTSAAFAAPEEPALEKFLAACAARLEGPSSDPSPPGILRPVRVYVTKKTWAETKGSLKVLEEGGWIQSAESDVTPVSYTKDDVEVTFSPRGKRLAVLVERIPAAMRALRDNRIRFLYDLDNADIGYAPLFGEGSANEAMFPAGESAKLFFVSGNYLDSGSDRGPLMLSCFTKGQIKLQKAWEAELTAVGGGPAQGRGALARYIHGRGWELKAVPNLASADLESEQPLSYRSENSGDGGCDVGFIGLDGKLQVVHHVFREGDEVTLPEERYLRSR